MKVVLILSIVSCFFIVGCSSENEVDKDKIAHLYVDLLVTQETYKYNVDSLEIAVDSLYKEYQLTEQQYKSSLEKFKYDEQTWSEFFKLAEVYLDTLKAQEERRIADKKKEKKELKGKK